MEDAATRLTHVLLIRSLSTPYVDVRAISSGMIVQSCPNPPGNFH
eukprot:COSAG02_NODE_1443_length_12584_cov_2.587425_7_plen_45_part_00